MSVRANTGYAAWHLDCSSPSRAARTDDQVTAYYLGRYMSIGQVLYIGPWRGGKETLGVRPLNLRPHVSCQEARDGYILMYRPLEMALNVPKFYRLRRNNRT